MPHFTQRHSPRSIMLTSSGTFERKMTLVSGGAGTTAARLARQLHTFHRQHSSPAQLLDHIPEEEMLNDTDVVSLKSITAWSAFGDIDVELREKTVIDDGIFRRKSRSKSITSLNEKDQTRHCIGKIFHADMFNVFLSLAKDGANGTSGTNANNKEQLVIAVYKQSKAKKRLIETYKRLRNALKHMKEEYEQSKSQNLLIRYNHMQKMIYEVVQMDRQYWQHIDIPAQAISETPQAYVLRVADLLDDQSGSHEPLGSHSSLAMTSGTKCGGGAIAQLLGSTICIAERTKETSIFSGLRSTSLEQLREECIQLSTELYRLIHKYQALRLAVRELARAYQHTRYYPLVPRYNLLKAMIKRILRTPIVAENDPMLEQ